MIMRNPKVDHDNIVDDVTHCDKVEVLMKDH